jgi:hypothetical protein
VLVLGQEKDIDRWLDADDWYALVFETAELIMKHLDLWEYDALHYASLWLRGEADHGNG